jgi:hydroxyacylglutathione hydrolase
MTQETRTINLGGVNCYLVKAGDGFVLIDTGISSKRGILQKELASAGSRPGKLKLVILTHGDVDHADNSAYLRAEYGTEIAMHRDDAGMVERGDMSWNRKARPDRISAMGRIIILMGRILPFFGGPGKFAPFTPDLYLEDGQDLSAYGLHAQVLHLPGHSKGSIGILTAAGDLFCGDLLMNMIRPDVHFMVDDLAAAHASIEKLKSLRVHTVYPGHGKPFSWEQFRADYR